MAAWLDLCRFRASAGSTTDFVYSSAIGGCQSPAAANVTNGTVYKWLAISDDLTQWEIFEGAYTTSSTTAARTTVLYNSSGTGTKTPGQSGAGTKINFSAAPQVACIGIKEDLISIEEANSFTATQQNQAQKNINVPAVLRGYIDGLILSTAGSSTAFTVGAGVATDSTAADVLSLSSSLSKTTGAWAVGGGNGSLDTGTIAASTWYYPYAIKRVDTQVVDALTSLAPGTSSTVTISNASPANVTWTNCGLQANAPVVFTTTGSLPTGLTAGTQYYVKTVVDANTFTVSATQGGTAINTSSAGSGTHTGTSVPILPANYTLSRRLGALKTNGSSQWAAFVQNGDAFRWVTSVNDVSNTTQSSTAVTYTLGSIPPGLSMLAKISVAAEFSATNVNSTVYVSALDQTDETPALPGSAGPLTSMLYAAGVSDGIQGVQGDVRTNASAQIRVRCTRATSDFNIQTFGWTDLRGKNN